MKPIVAEIWQHYKGGRYRIIGVAKMQDTHEEMVVYKSLEAKKDFPAGTEWLRPLPEFLSTVEVDGVLQPRFTRLANQRKSFGVSNFLLLGAAPFVVFMANYILYGLAPLWSTLHGADSYLHFFGGVSIAISTLYAATFIRSRELVIVRNRWLFALLVVAVVALCAVAWEIFEFVSDTYWGTFYQPSIYDTMKDLILGTLGGAVVALFAVLKK